MAEALPVASPFVWSSLSQPSLADGLDSVTACNSSPPIWSRVDSLKAPFDSTLKRGSSIVKRLSSFKSHESVDQKAVQDWQPSLEPVATAKAVDAQCARRASKRNRIFRAVVAKWLTARKNTTEALGTLERNESQRSFRTQDGVVRQPPPDIRYGRLIEEALLYSDKPHLSAKKICKWIMENYKWYKDNQHDGWQGKIFKELSENPSFETVSIRRRGRSCQSIKWSLTPAGRQKLDDEFFSRRQPFSASSEVVEWMQNVRPVSFDAHSTLAESVTTATVVGSAVSSLPTIYEADGNSSKKIYVELDGGNIGELPGDSTAAPPSPSPVPKRALRSASSLASRSVSGSKTLRTSTVLSRSSSPQPGDSVSVVSVTVPPSPILLSRKPARPSPLASLIAGHAGNATVCPLEEAISSSSGARSPFICVVSPPDDVVSLPSEATLPPGEVISPPREAISPLSEIISPVSEIISPRSDTVSPLVSAVSSPGGATSPSRSRVWPSRGIRKALERKSNLSSPVVTPKDSLRRVASNLLRRGKISSLAKPSARKMKVDRVPSFHKGDELDFYARRNPISLNPSPDILQDDIDVLTEATIDTQPSESDLSSTEPQDAQGSTSSEGASSSQTSFGSTQGSQRSENSTGTDSSKRSTSQESGESGGGNGSGDQGDSDDEQKRRRKRPRAFKESPTRKKFACIYYKSNPQVYGIHGDKRFRTCQCTGYDFISELRRHLMRVHGQHVCNDCYQIFGDKRSCDNCRHPRGIRKGLAQEAVWEDLWMQQWPNIPPPANKTWERGNQTDAAFYAQGSGDSLPTDGVEMPNFATTSSNSPVFRSESVYTHSQPQSYNVSPIEQAPVNDQLFQLTGRLGRVEEAMSSIENKVQLLNHVPAISEISATLSDRMDSLEAKISELDQAMKLFSQLCLNTSIVGNSQPPADYSASFAQQVSANVPLNADSSNAGNYGDFSEAGYNNGVFADAISNGVNVVEDYNFDWSDNSNDSPSSLFQRDIHFPDATTSGQGASESQLELPLSLEPMGWVGPNDFATTRNLDGIFREIQGML